MRYIRFIRLDSVIGRYVLNCVLRYYISLNSIMNTDIKLPDVIGRINANENHLAALPLLRDSYVVKTVLYVCRTITL